MADDTRTVSIPFTTEHLLDHLRIEADAVVNRGIVTRGQRLVIRDLLLKAVDEIARLRAAGGRSDADQAVLAPWMGCWSCGSRNVNVRDHDGHGATVHLNPAITGRLTTTCVDCGAVWTGQAVAARRAQETDRADEKGGSQ